MNNICEQCQGEGAWWSETSMTRVSCSGCLAVGRCPHCGGEAVDVPEFLCPVCDWWLDIDSLRLDLNERLES